MAKLRASVGGVVDGRAVLGADGERPNPLENAKILRGWERGISGCGGSRWCLACRYRLATDHAGWLQNAQQSPEPARIK